ncbi:tRNA lysidine(34) synthetase TilS [Azonexus sp. IMCC34839]|uniref:tRNA lysidine(34) synthetase TilS n=1 Tax=Azonexus sp. IMCC34839 TaxID=3133695 RepID=UPI00399AED4B
MLLHLLAKSRFSAQLSAIHVHHGLSLNADAWQAHCVAFCSGLDVPLCVRHVAVDRAGGEGLEAAARRARYAAFAQCDADFLLLAQHRGDQAETLLFNLLRGAGVVGVAAIPVERKYLGKRILRPLLSVSRAEIEAYAEEYGLSWVDDESNADISFSRNFLRHEILPTLAARFPGAESGLAQAAENFAEASALLDELAAQDWTHVALGDEVQIKQLRQLSTERIKNMLRFRLRQLGWRTPDAPRLAEFVRQLRQAAPDRHPALLLPDGEMRVAQGRLTWRPK